MSEVSPKKSLTLGGGFSGEVLLRKFFFGHVFVLSTGPPSRQGLSERKKKAWGEMLIIKAFWKPLKGFPRKGEVWTKKTPYLPIGGYYLCWGKSVQPIFRECWLVGES